MLVHKMGMRLFFHSHGIYQHTNTWNMLKKARKTLPFSIKMEVLIQKQSFSFTYLLPPSQK